MDCESASHLLSVVGWAVNRTNACDHAEPFSPSILSSVHFWTCSLIRNFRMCTPFRIIMVTPIRASSDTSSRWMKWSTVSRFFTHFYYAHFLLKEAISPLQLFRKLQIDFFKTQFSNERTILVASDDFQGNFRKVYRNFPLQLLRKMRNVLPQLFMNLRHIPLQDVQQFENANLFAVKCCATS